MGERKREERERERERERKREGGREGNMQDMNSCGFTEGKKWCTFF